MRYFSPQQINHFFPVIGIIKYNGGIQIRRGCNLSLKQARYLHERKKITVVSKRSLDRLALLVRGCSVKFTSLMTLTYGANFPMSGRVAKKNLNHALITFKRKFGRFEYVWVLEFQERGAVHFHLATTLPPPTILEREIFAFTWQEITTPYHWPYSSVMDYEGMVVFKKLLYTDEAVFDQHRHESAWEKVRKGDSLSHYFAKYTMKIRQKKIPSWYSDVGRFWGASEGVRLPDGEYFHGNQELVRQLADAYGRDLRSWEVLPKIILLG